MSVQQLSAVQNCFLFKENYYNFLKFKCLWQNLKEQCKGRITYKNAINVKQMYHQNDDNKNSLFK